LNKNVGIINNKPEELELDDSLEELDGAELELTDEDSLDAKK